MAETVNITWYGHSCFKLECRGYSVVLDPYANGKVPGLPPLALTADAVYCSHYHDDHGCAEAVRLVSGGAPCPFAVTELETEHDGEGGRLRGMNTVRIFTAGRLRVAHMGDVGRPLRKHEAETLRGVDALLIPVGGYYTIDAAQAAEMVDIISPRVTIPMHYRSGDIGFSVLAAPDDFVKRFDNVEHCGGSFALTEDTPKRLLVMTPTVM